MMITSGPFASDDRVCFTSLHTLNSFPMESYIWNCPRRTPLTDACERGSIDSIQALLGIGALPNVMDGGWNDVADGSWNALKWACYESEGRERRETALQAVKLLVAVGANLDARCGTEGSTALHAASKRGNLRVINFLLACGASPLIRDDCGAIAREYFPEWVIGGPADEEDEDKFVFFKVTPPVLTKPVLPRMTDWYSNAPYVAPVTRRGVKTDDSTDDERTTDSRAQVSGIEARKRHRLRRWEDLIAAGDSDSWVGTEPVAIPRREEPRVHTFYQVGYLQSGRADFKDLGLLEDLVLSDDDDEEEEEQVQVQEEQEQEEEEQEHEQAQAQE